jgi:thiamine-phosphate pyrophosphorylase
MTSRRPQSGAKRPAPRLYLVAGPVVDAAALEAALASADVAAVLLSLPQADERTSINLVKQFAPVVQGRDAALVLDGHPEIVARAGADGAHLSGADAIKTAIGSLKPDRIAGAGGLHSRHEAMLAAEAGADYVMFGEPDEAGRRPILDAIVERISWWSELFEIPCVAFAGNLDEVEPLVQAGADFVALGDFVWTDSRGPVALVNSAAEQLRSVEAV